MLGGAPALQPVNVRRRIVYADWTRRGSHPSSTFGHRPSSALGNTTSSRPLATAPGHTRHEAGAEAGVFASRTRQVAQALAHSRAPHADIIGAADPPECSARPRRYLVTPVTH